MSNRNGQSTIKIWTNKNPRDIPWAFSAVSGIIKGIASNEYEPQITSTLINFNFFL
jgi:hypothetical protein